MLSKFTELTAFTTFLQVAWMRVSDGHILTVDTTKFISDDRFMVIKPEDREEWNLIIR